MSRTEPARCESPHCGQLFPNEGADVRVEDEDGDLWYYCSRQCADDHWGDDLEHPTAEVV